jgi:hypothetical protein
MQIENHCLIIVLTIQMATLWRVHLSFQTVEPLPSGYVKIAIENDHL